MKGEGNQQDYGMRVYDPRIGKFLSVDPLTKSYPELTPYQFASNRPIDGIDLDGLEHSPAGKNTGGVPRDNTAVLRMPSIGEIDAVIANQQEAPFKLLREKQQSMTLSQDYTNTSWGSKGGFEASKKMVEYEANFIPGASLGIKKLKGEEVTRKDVIIEAAVTFIPVGRVFRGLKGAGVEVIEQVVKKTDNIAAHLTEKDIAGALLDIKGTPVEINGYVYDHLDEVKNALTGLENQIGKLNKAIEKGKFGEDVLHVAENLRSNLQKQKDKIQAVLDRAINAEKVKK